MDITTETRISDIATADPGTIRVFQQHQIDFCCGGKIPLAEACALHGIEPETLIAELNAAGKPDDEARAWETLTSLVAHIQARYHEPLRAELPRLSAMVAKVVLRHGDRLPETLLPLRDTFDSFARELLSHMSREDAVLFPAIVEAEAAASNGQEPSWPWIVGAIHVMERDHDSAGSALGTMRELTNDYTPPADACPTFRGLYHGLAELERDMHIHVHLENNILFPRATGLAKNPQ